MELAVLVVGVVIMAMGALGMLAPEALLTVARSIVTPVGLWVVAAVRVGLGVLLLMTASLSRVPAVLGVLGVVVLVSGLVTPFLGVERARAIVEWWGALGPAVTRVWAGIAVALGALLVYAVAPRPRAI